MLRRIPFPLGTWWRWLGYIFIVAVLATTACGGKVTQSPRPGGPITITFAVWDYERPMYAPLAEQFMREHAGVAVVLVSLEELVSDQGDGAPSPVAMVRRIVSGADTAQAFSTQPEVLRSNLLLDLKPFLDADPNVGESDFYPNALEQYTVDGKLKVLPRTMQLRVLAYNKELFASANLPLPTADWTWSDLLAKASQLAVKRGSTVSTYGFFDISGGMTTFFGLLEERGIDLIQMDADEVRLDREEIVSTAEQLCRYFDDGTMLATPQWLPDEAREGKAKDTPNAFDLALAGHLAIWDEQLTLFDYSEHPKRRTFDFAVGKVPYPMSHSDLAMLGGGGGYMISSGTRHPEMAWQWIEFLSRQAPEFQVQGEVAVARSPIDFPARKSVAERMGYWNELDEETRQAYQAVLERRVAGLKRSPNEALLEVLWQTLMPIFSGQGCGKDIQQQLAEAQRRFEEQVAARSLTPTPSPDDAPVVVATPWPQVAPAGAAAVRFTSFVGGEAFMMRRRARTFHERHPEMFVEVVGMDGSIQPTTVEKLADTYDCFIQNTPIADASNANAVLDLQPLFDADQTIALEDYPVALLDAMRYEGRLVGIPLGLLMRVLVVNKTAFDQAGIALPSAQWTPDDFQRAALALTSGEGEAKRYGYVPPGNHPIEDIRFFVRQFGSDLILGDTEHPRPNFDDPKVIEAVRWYLNLAKVHQVMPPITFFYRRDDQGEQIDSYSLIRNGRAGMWLDYGYGPFEYGEPPDAGPEQFTVQVAPPPVGRAGIGDNDLMLSGIFHISAQSEHPQVCWEWFKHLADDPSLMEWSIPARQSLVHSEAYRSRARPRSVEMAQVYAQVLNTPGIVSSINPAPPYVELYWFFDALMHTIQRDADLEAELIEAQRKTTAFLECVSNGKAQSQCARQVDANYNGYLNEEPVGMRVGH